MASIPEIKPEIPEFVWNPILNSILNVLANIWTWVVYVVILTVWVLITWWTTRTNLKVMGIIAVILLAIPIITYIMWTTSHCIL